MEVQKSYLIIEFCIEEQGALCVTDKSMGKALTVYVLPGNKIFAY